MKVALISDVHSNLPAVENVFKEIKDLDYILCAGDLIGYNPFPSEVISFFRENDISSVLGNHDYAYLEKNTDWFNSHAAEAIYWTIENTSDEDRKYIKNLPKRLEEEIGDTSFYVVHGSPSSINEYVYPQTYQVKLKWMLEETDSDVLVLGHTHVPMIKEFDNGYVVNPDSVGQPRDGDKRASFLVVDLDEMSFHNKRVSYDIDLVNEKIRESGLPNKIGERLYFGQ